MSKSGIRPRILVVEDEALVARDIQVQLEALGYEHVGRAADGEGAVRLAGELRPDLVLMDIQLAGAMDGIEAATAIRARWSLPIVFLTAFAEDETIARAKLIQPFGYIVKPFSERELRTVLELALYISKADATLRASEQRFRAIFDESPLGVALIDSQTAAFLELNPRFAAIAGRSIAELASMDWKTITHPDDVQADQEQMDRLNVGEIDGFSMQKRYLRPDGSSVWINMTIAKLIVAEGISPRHLTMIEDITARRAAEEARRSSDSRYQAMVQSVDAGIVTVDGAGLVVAWNPSAQSIFGHPADEMIGHSLARLMPGTLHERHSTGMARVMANGERRLIGKGPAEVQGYHRDGRPLWLSLQLSEWQLSDELFFTAVIEDITDTKVAERRLRLQGSALEAAANAIVITDRAGTVEWANSAFFALTGYDHNDVVGTKAGRILRSGTHEPGFYESLWTTILGGAVWHGEIVNRRKDGTLYTEDMTITPLKNEQGEVTNFIAVKLDISEKKKLETAFRHAQKMESVGRLAGGVAHDFNNMLGVILGHTEEALQQVDSAHPLRESLTEILHAATRSAALTQQLLAFASKQPAIPKVLDIRETVAGLVKLLRRMIGANITIDWKPGKVTWPILMDPSQLDQILTNLCVNARDAITQTGTITIETSNHVVDTDDWLRHPQAVVGEHVRLVVRDTGTGIEPSVLQHIFEPFFTTKAVGIGTGLGLATVHGIVAQNGGFVIVTSALGQGTAFELYFPRHLGEAVSLPGEGKTSAPSAPAVASGEGETILVVEDEPGVLRFASRMLSEQGYVVLSAGHPAEAIRLAAEHTAAIHLLLTDVIMPEMNGLEVANRLQASRPTLKRLFMSGYTADVMRAQGDVDAETHFIQKPFLKAELLSKVRGVLDRKES